MGLPFAASTRSRIGAVGASEIGRGCVLACLDDAAARLASFGEEVEQRLAVAVPNGALEMNEVLCETRQHLQRGFAIVEEHVTPHGGVGGGNAREIAESAG